MKISVYIASPYSIGDVAVNVRESLLMADKLESLGYMVYAPLLSHFRHMIAPHEYEYWLERDKEWLLKCDCVLRMPGQSMGANTECWFANDNNIPVFLSIEELASTTIWRKS